MKQNTLLKEDELHPEQFNLFYFHVMPIFLSSYKCGVSIGCWNEQNIPKFLFVLPNGDELQFADRYKNACCLEVMPLVARTMKIRMK